MKALIALIFLLAWSASSQILIDPFSSFPGGGGGGGASCTLYETNVAVNGNGEIGNEDHYYYQTVYTNLTGSTITICQLDFWLKRIGTGGEDITSEVYDEDSDSPGNSALYTSTTTVSHGDVSDAGFEWVQFEYSGFEMTNNQVIWLGMKTAGYDASNYYEFGRGSYGIGTQMRTDNPSVGWDSWTDRAICIRIYTSE